MTATALVFLPVAFAYTTAVLWCVDVWLRDDGYFGHGPLVPLVMVLVFWLRRPAWRQRPAAPDLRGLWLLGPALLLHLVGAALTIDSLSAASMILAVPGAAWLALGRQRLAGLWPALWLVAFAVPLPLYVTGRIAFELKEVAVHGGVWLANATGLAVYRDGAWLHVPGRTELLDVADPCGGLRSLLAMVTLVYCVAFFVGPASPLRRVVLLALAAPIAIAVNIVRIAVICHLAAWQGVPFASGTGHDVVNAGAWVLDLVVVFLADALLGGRNKAAPAPAASAVGPAAPALPAAATLRRAGIALWVCAVALFALSIYRPYTESRGRADALPAAAGAFTLANVYPMSQRFFELLGTDDATWRHYQGPDGGSAFVVAVFHGSNWKSVHPPHICLDGSDMELLDERLVTLDGVDGTVGRLLLRTRREGRPYLSLFAFADKDSCTGSYLTFFLHHAPRALVRASNEGFLLRVEAYGDGPGGVPAAEERCRALMRELLDAARRQLP